MEEENLLLYFLDFNNIFFLVGITIICILTLYIFKKAGLLSKLLCWISKILPRPRFWTKEEWNGFDTKTKIWIFYKHHYTLIGHGKSETDQFLFMFQMQFLGLFTMWLVLIKTYNLPNWVWPFPIFFFFANKGVMWYVGNWKDKKDWIAWETELANKRNKVFREIRNRARNGESL